MDGNVRTIWIATVAAELVPYLPLGKQVMTMLCLPMDPKVYVLGSLDGCGRLGCLWSSMLVAAVCSLRSVQIHPTVYSL